ncbi:MAG TPA: hypothetical protein VFW93_15565 [Aquabacterium sp.]|uniref:hypothetical protein n=1 Tax=Aquabacterium sp. TaxID=1872578 RepID=UPI002E30420E|nr:hypothetical protein [Aquabacterium sp.]HEX5357630.1 hypothetical protein [Aquabacterium sp.]
MFASLKRLIGSAPAARDEGQVLGAWAKSEGFTFKRVKDKTGGGYVVETKEGWRVEWGGSQRSYISGQELRFRCDTGLPGDVQMVMVSRVLAQLLESEVFSSFTNAMQTQIDNSLPDEMRWLAMHPKVSLNAAAVLAKRFVLLANAEGVAQAWLNPEMVMALEEAATTWWTDSLLLVLTVNRGMLTVRMPGEPLEVGQLHMVGELFARIARRMRDVALAGV